MPEEEDDGDSAEGFRIGVEGDFGDAATTDNVPMRRTKKPCIE